VAADLAAMLPVSLLTRISLKVFHCPHAGHLPIHFGDSCPQLEQTYAILSFAMFLGDDNLLSSRWDMQR